MLSSRYWCYIPVSVPWRSSGNFRDLRIWLLDNVPATDWEIEGHDPKNLDNRIVRFTKKQDAVLFALRWS